MIAGAGNLQHLHYGEYRMSVVCQASSDEAIIKFMNLAAFVRLRLASRGAQAPLRSMLALVSQ